MNGDKYKELIEALKREKAVDEKVDKLAIMVCMMANNDLKHLWIAVRVLLVLEIANLLMPESWNVVSLLQYIARSMG